MKKILIATLISFGLLSNITNAEKSNFTPVNWVSENTGQKIVINNPQGLHLFVLVTVDKWNPDGISSAIRITSCGSINYIEPGKSAVCETSSSTNFISFSSTTGETAKGTYQIEVAK